MLGGGSGAFSDVVVVFFRSKQIETDFMVDSFVFFIRAALTLPSTFFFAGNSSSKNNKNSFSSSFFSNIELYVLKRTLSGGCK